ncbi:hypothetical protein F5B22DRAFT_651556 [Xylaria bambusicola]|uniref:uncharacterized protein n=1 Tax=Xylaria bambusicola TaxID=326684 RepID=UPI0020089E1F|nr:uncharacterized protein F5B22DRAFT_651556 [Xylaria bambusicola]KAI0505622.1 hypothetical protein F5B22DRAFT_651556 [Xylaria bambusicola]
MTTARTNLGPLTTPFSYPAHCTVAVKQCESCDVFWQAQTCSDNSNNAQGVQDDPQCWPERQNLDLSTGVALNGWGFYSPGISCPIGYETSCVATGTVNGGFPFQFSVLPRETAVGCCPSGFQCKHNPGVDGAQTCYSIATTGSFPVVSCSSGKSNDFADYVVPATVTETVGSASTSLAVALINTVTIYAPLFQLNFQSTDLPSVNPDRTAASTLSSTHTIPGDSSSPTSSAAGGLSTGAKAGIGVGAAVGAIGSIALLTAIFLYYRKRARKSPSELMVTEQSPSNLKQPIYHPQTYSQPAQPVELSSQSYYSQLS